MDETMSSVDVLIAGGSYAGLSLAVALASEAGGDLRVMVVAPRFPNLAAEGGAYGIAPADLRGSALSRGSLNLLDRIGIWRDLAVDTQPVSEIVLTDSDLGDALRPSVLKFGLEAEAGARIPAMVIVENHRLGAALYRAALGAAGVELRGGISVAASVVVGDGVVATLSDGRQVRARLIVAADGARSDLRVRSGIGVVGWPYGQTGIVTVVATDEPHGGRAVQHFLPGGPFALLPMTDGRVCVTWTENDAEARRILRLDATAFRAEVEARVGSVLGALTSISVPQSWPIELGVARQLTAPRLALVGDAAHAVHPIAGQGLNLGFRDVGALVDAVIDAARLGLDVGHPDVLAGYERARRFDNLASAAGFDVLNRVFSSGSTVARSARGAALGVVDRLPRLKDWFIAEASGASGDVPRLLRSLT
jgi:2-octaprenyl-6-methoxyphenol hydroxylase